jgi:succinoglycan biosynthesis transport protein ExoP
MSLLQFFSILRARRGVAGLILLATLALAAVWVLTRQANFTARAPVLVDVRTDPTNVTPLQGMVAPSFITTQIDIVKSDRVAERVVKMLPPDQAPLKGLLEEAQKESHPPAWVAHMVRQRLEVKPARESNIINIAWTGRTPAEAARVANAFAQAYLETSLEIRTDPAKKYADWFDEQVKASREKLEKAQARLSEFQQKSGILSSEERGDFETARLTELSQQLMNAQGRGRSGPAASSDASPLVNNLRQDVARMEAKVGEASATMGAAHPAMQKLQSELSAMRSRLAQESSRVGAAGESSAAASRAREREIQNALQEQKNRVLSLNKQRGELSLLQRDVDTAQKAFEAVSASAAQSRLQAMSTQTNVMRLASAVEPLDPTGPTPSQALMVALFAGTLLAVAGALMLELLNRRVRSASDLSSVTQLPILATVPSSSATFKPLRLPASRRLALASPGRSAA